MKIFNTKVKNTENADDIVVTSEVLKVEVENTEITDMGDSAIDDLEKVVGISNEIKQQSTPKAFFSGNKNIKALAENDVVISRVIKNVLDWLLLVTSASTIRREEYEDLTEQMIKFEDDVTLQMELQVKFKRAFEQLQKKQQEQSALLEQLSKMRLWVIGSTIVSVVAIVIAIIAMLM